MIVDFTSVYEKYAQDVYRFAWFLCGDPVLAEDITAETFVRAWVTPGEIRVGTVKAYLLMIARNLFRAGLLRDRRHIRLDDELHAQLPDPKPGPDSVTGARQELQMVLNSLGFLSESDRAALLMHALEGMPYNEIAAVLGVSVTAAKVKVHRSRIKLNNLRKLERGS